ncbi:HAD domain-containing protein [Lysinibacillus sp. UGB7]|uniref:HAD domain-containing protein n=1 Tax=Lysinibacillus sp. UGB7 TaxID=3411039 RepID=UPI003B79B19E
MNIIFLDIDGMMNHLNHFIRSDKHILQEFCPIAVKNLKRIIRECDAKIVVSSTWRKIANSVDGSIEEWLFSHYDLENDVIGITPYLANEIRGKEIESYLNSCQHPVGKFVIIDDDNDMGELINHLVRTDYRYGLTVEKCDAAIKVLT